MPPVSKNMASIAVGFVPARQKSKKTLSAGVYSLGARSNVPFVTFVGDSNFVKTFTWGEVVEVPDHTIVTVQNASFHDGDIFINQGADFDNRPARVTVPCRMSERFVDDEDFWVFEPAFPLDVRMARRAYFMMESYVTGPNTTKVAIRGKRIDGSHDAVNWLQNFTISGIFPDRLGTGYLAAFDAGPGDVLFNIPLGSGCLWTGDDSRPMFLLDTAEVAVIQRPSVGAPYLASPTYQSGGALSFTLPPAYYTLEY